MGKQERYSEQSVVVISGRRVYGISRSRNGERPGNGTTSYRKEREGMLRQNQWHDLTVRVFM